MELHQAWVVTHKLQPFLFLHQTIQGFLLQCLPARRNGVECSLFAQFKLLLTLICRASAASSSVISPGREGRRRRAGSLNGLLNSAISKEYKGFKGVLNSGVNRAKVVAKSSKHDEVPLV